MIMMRRLTRRPGTHATAALITAALLLGTTVHATTSVGISPRLRGPEISTAVASDVPAEGFRSDRPVVVPVTFEPNVGQAPASTAFVARGQRFVARFVPGGLDIALPRPPSNLVKTGARRPAGKRPEAAAEVLSMRFEGSSEAVRFEGRTRLEGVANYLGGSDESKWLRNIPTYRSVRVVGLYPGIDAEFYERSGNLEYDLIVAPGADTSAVRVQFAGVKATTVDTAGNVVLRLNGAEVRHTRAVCHQVGEDGSRISVAAQSRENADGTFGFELGEFDRSKALTIDPVLEFSTFLGGGAGFDNGTAIAVDSSGSIYVAGNTSSTDFPVTSGAFDTSTDGYEMFVVKLNSAATEISYATYLGGTGSETTIGLDVDSSGSVVMVGYTDSNDFPITLGAFDSSLGVQDGFATRLNASGTGLVYSTYLGGSDSDVANAVAVDASGAATIVGSTSSADFPTTPGAFDTDIDFNDAFVLRLAGDGTTLDFSTSLGGGGSEAASSVAIDSTGASYVTGYTGSGDFPTTSGVFTENHAGNGDAFLTKVSGDGTALIYSTFFGGAGPDSGVDLKRLSSNEVVIAGQTGSTDLPTTVGAFDEEYSGGGNDLFIARFNVDADGLVFSTFLGVAGNEEFGGLGVDSSGACVVTGRSSSPDFPTTIGAFDTTFDSNAGQEAFVTKLEPDGSALAFSTFVSGAFPSDVTADGDGSVLVVGYSNSETFPHGSRLPFEPRDFYNAFLLRLTADGSTLVFSRLIGGDSGGGDTDTAVAHAVDPSGNIYLLGIGAPTFPTTPGSYDPDGGGTFVAKLDSAGAALVYGTFIPHSTGACIEVDPSGAAYIGGLASEGFPTTAGAFDTSFEGGGDGFVAKLAADGSSLIYSTLIGGSGGDSVYDLALDGAGRVTPVGATDSVDFPVTPGSFDTTYNDQGSSYSDGFISRLNPSGSAIVWASYLGGAMGSDHASSVELDSFGRPTVLGQTLSVDFPVAGSVFDPTYNGDVTYDYIRGDMFVTRFAVDGSSLEFSTFLGGSGSDEASDLAVDTVGNSYIVGTTFSVDYPITAGAADAFYAYGEALLTKLNSSGSALIYSTFIGGGNYDKALAVSVASDDSVFVAGWTYSLNFPTTPGALRRQLAGEQDGFVTKVAPGGNSFTYSTLLGGDSYDQVADLSLSATGAVIASGSTASSDFAQTGFGDRDTSNAFVARLLPISNGIDLSVSKSHAGVFRVGSNETYTLNVTNQGSDASSAQIVLTDILPAGLSFVSGNGVGWNVGAVGQTVTATRSSPLASGASSVVTLVVTPSVAALPGVTNTASVSTTNDVNLLNNAASDPTTVTRGTADLLITSTESADPVVSGAMLSYSIVVRNDGPDPALDVVVTDPLGVGTLFGSASVSQGSFTAPPVGQIGTVSASLGTIPSGQQATVTVTTTVTANGGSVVSNTATAVTSSADSFQLNNFASVSTGVVGTPLLGNDTIGITITATGAWFLKNANTPGGADLVFGFGPPAVSWVALKGDWNGDGVDTPGLYDPSTGAFFLRNSSSPGPADLVFTFGPGAVGWLPVAGDWDGNGADSVGLYVPDTAAFFLKNSNAPGAADIVFTFGPTGAGAVPLAGDWDGDGDDAIGLYISSTATFFLKNANSPGPADTAFTFGGPGLVPVTGDWDNSGTDTVGLYVTGTGTWFLRNSNTPGPADLAFGYGPPNATPIAGDWDNQ